MKNLFYSAILFTVFFLSCSTEPTPTYTLSVGVYPDGSAGFTASPQQEVYDEGTLVTITVTPEEQYIYNHWTDEQGNSKNENPFTIEMNSDRDITLILELKKYPLEINVIGGGSVTEQILQGKPTDYDYGTSVLLTAVPENSGSKFVGWTGDVSETSEKTIIVQVTKPTTITATFVNTFSLADNGVTIQCDEADFGDSGEVNGVLYTKRDYDDITPQNASTTCTSGVTFLGSVFKNQPTFNEDISHWDVSDVVVLFETFRGAESFNQDLDHWDVSNVESFIQMFMDAKSFNGKIGSWNVNKAANASNGFLNMFLRAESFNQDIGDWDISGATNLAQMFIGAFAFNQDISRWDVSNVENMSRMFYGAYAFNQDLSDWNVSNVKYMSTMFAAANAFNQDLSSWDMSSVVTTELMFYEADVFNQDISSWDVSNVENMQGMFAMARAFNQDVSSWNVSKVKDFRYMFEEANSFNQDIGSWNVSSATQMDGMFLNNPVFNQDLSSWCVPTFTAMPSDFDKNASAWVLPRPVWGTCPQ